MKKYLTLLLLGVSAFSVANVQSVPHSADKGVEAIAPEWHKRELEKTEARVAAGIERPIPWASVKEIIKNAFP